MIAAFIPLAIVLAQPAAASHRISSTEPLFVSLPAGWAAGEDAPPGPAFPFETRRFAPEGDRNAVCLISLLAKDRADLTNREALDFLLRNDSRPYWEPGQRASDIEVKELPFPGGLVLFANFTDQSLVGKPPVRGDYKTATSVLVSIGTGYLIKITILCDDLAGRDYAEALEIVKSIRIREQDR
ncbi:MAG TPA: hypothetical protein VIK52_02070 [Opitutaceae bacterium]